MHPADHTRVMRALHIGLIAATVLVSGCSLSHAPHLRTSRHSLVPARFGDRCGLVDYETGHVVVDFVYQNIDTCDGMPGRLLCERPFYATTLGYDQRLASLLDAYSGRLVFPATHCLEDSDSTPGFAPASMPISWDNARCYVYGAVDQSGRVVAPFEFRYYGYASDVMVLTHVESPALSEGLPPRQAGMFIDMRSGYASPIFEDIFPYGLESRTFIVAQNGSYGLMARGGHWIAEPVFDYIWQLLGRLDGKICLAVRDRSGMVGVINEEGTVILPRSYSAVEFADASIPLLAVRTGNRWHLVDLAGNPVEQGSYDSIDPDRDRKKSILVGVMIISGKPGRYAEGIPVRVGTKMGLVSSRPERAIPPIYQNIRPFQGGYAAFQSDGHWGFLAEGGRIAVSPEYDEVQDFKYGHAACLRDGVWSVLDTGLRSIVLGEVEEVDLYWQGVIGTIDAEDRRQAWTFEGKPLFDPQWQFVRAMAPGGRRKTEPSLLLGKKGDAFRLVDLDGTVVVERSHARRAGVSPIYNTVKGGERISHFDSSRIPRFATEPPQAHCLRYETGRPATRDFRYMALDASLSRPLLNDDLAEPLLETCGGRQLVKSARDGKWRMLDVSISPPLVEGLVYEDAHGTFHAASDLVPVRTGADFGYISIDGQWVIAPQFSDAAAFDRGLAIAAIDGRYGYVRRDGSWAIPPSYDSCTSFKHGFASVSRAGAYGAIDRTGRAVSEIVYDEPLYFDPDFGVLYAEREGRQVIIRPDGKIIWHESIAGKLILQASD